jgi:HEPN domain-containing protein
VKKSSANWLNIAAKDLKMAKVSLREEEPLSVIYHLHASVEKILKGISDAKGIVPPKIHSLKQLALDVCEINLEKHQSDLLNLLDKAFISSRYPEEVEKFEEEYDIEKCQELILNVEVIIKWLKNLIETN